MLIEWKLLGQEVRRMVSFCLVSLEFRFGEVSILEVKGEDGL